MVKDEASQDQVLEILKDRATSYGFLSGVYYQEVSAELLESLVSELASVATEEPDSEGYGLLGGYARGIRKADLRQAVIDLGAEFIALLLGASAYAVSPYESVYTSSERLLMQKARDEVLVEYRKEDLARIGEFRHPEDHIAIELEFMSYLCQKTAEAIEQGDRSGAVAYLHKQKSFLDRHLLKWVPQFCEDLAEAATSDFYRGIALITRDHLALETESIGELIGLLQDAGEG